MPHVEFSTQIDAPPQAVWDLVSDLARIPEWVTFTHEMVEIPEGGPATDAIYKERGGVGPMKSVSTWKITEFDPSRWRQVHEGDLGVMKPVLVMEVRPEGEGTVFVQEMDFRMMPFFRPLGVLLEALFVKRSMRNGLRDTQANAKAILESEAR